MGPTSDKIQFCPGPVVPLLIWDSAQSILMILDSRAANSYNTVDEASLDVRKILLRWPYFLVSDESIWIMWFGITRLIWWDFSLNRKI